MGEKKQRAQIHFSRQPKLKFPKVKELLRFSLSGELISHRPWLNNPAAASDCKFLFHLLHSSNRATVKFSSQIKPGDKPGTTHFQRSRTAVCVACSRFQNHQKMLFQGHISTKSRAPENTIRTFSYRWPNGVQRSCQWSYCGWLGMYEWSQEPLSGCPAAMWVWSGLPLNSLMLRWKHPEESAGTPSRAAFTEPKH